MKEEYKGYMIEVEQDQFADDPRNWDNLGKMVCFHKRYNLPNEFEDGLFKSEDFEGWEELKQELKSQAKARIILPVYMIDHGDIAFKTSSFNDPWDSGQVGFIYATDEDIKKEFGITRISKKHEAQTRAILEIEVQTYSQYSSGDVWTSYVFEKIYCDKCGMEHAEQIDGCGDIYGYNEAVDMAKSTIDRLAKKQ